MTPALKCIELRNCTLESFQGCKRAFLSSLYNLETVRLERCDIGLIDIGTSINDLLRSSTKLQKLTLTYIGLPGENLIKLLSAAGEAKNLTSLSLKNLKHTLDST